MSDPFAPGLLQRLGSVRNVAFVKASRIGDFLCATPAFRALRAALPDAEITMITLPILRELVERSPHLDRYAAFPGYPGLAEQFFDARTATQFFMEMQARQIAPHKRGYLRQNWLTAISLFLPALRVLRIFRALRVLRLARAGRSLNLVRLLTSINRGMRAIGMALGRHGLL